MSLVLPPDCGPRKRGSTVSLVIMSILLALPSLPGHNLCAGSQASEIDAANHQPVICIDPGHPSEVGSGTTGAKITEMQAAWDVALLLRSLLDHDGYRVVLTKSRENQFVANKRRAEIANECGAELMVRLHCDADAGSGLATYAPDRQGRSGSVTGPSPAVIAASQQAAHRFHSAVVKALRGALKDRGLHPDTMTRVGAQQGALTGSIYSHVPVVLVEMCVLTTEYDDDFMASPSGQQKMANALEAGVRAVVPIGRG